MTPEIAEGLIARIGAIEAEVERLRAVVAAEALAANQQQYLARCFDLLHMELAAVRTYVAELR